MRFEAYQLPLCGCGCDADWTFLGVIVAEDAEIATRIAARCAKVQIEYVYVVQCHHTTKRKEPDPLPHLTVSDRSSTLS